MNLSVLSPLQSALVTLASSKALCKTPLMKITGYLLLLEYENEAMFVSGDLSHKVMDK